VEQGGGKTAATLGSGNRWREIANYFRCDPDIRANYGPAARIRNIRAATIAGHSLAAVHLRLRERLAGHKASDLRCKPTRERDGQNQRSN